jgi:hypothetical protein
MKPRISILDRAFAYKPSYATAVAETWRRFGWLPTRRDDQKSPGQAHAFSRTARMWKSEHATNKGASI